MTRTFPRLAMFMSCGALATAAHYGFLIALVGMGFHALSASTFGALVGAGINYLLNYRFTFRSRKRHRQSMPRYFAVASMGFLLNSAMMAAVLGKGSHYLVAQMFATGVVLMWGFLANQYWTFGGERNAP